MNSSVKQQIKKLPTGKRPAIDREDITRQLLIRERAAREAAEDTVRATADYFALVVHELRGPLGAILGWSRVLRLCKADHSRVPEAIEIIERSAKMQSRLIDDLLDLARVPGGNLPLELQCVEVAPVIKAALDAVRPAAEAKGVELHMIFCPRAAPVKADPQRLEQVIWNLLWNAIKFTPQGGRIEARLERTERRVKVTVSDTGQGISADFLPYVFDRFSQARFASRREYGGLGLGLALVRSLVEMHGGTVSAESQGEGAGATFTIQLPLWGEDGRYEEWR